MMKDDYATGLDTKSKDKIPAMVKRPTKKKPKDKPKRPLSAYNFFFKEEREKILKVVLAEDPEKVDNSPDADDFLDEEALRKLRKEGGKVSFEEMGKIIGQRWKNIDPDRLTKYSELAAEDTERYKKEMQTYNGRQEAKMRSEALKPPTADPSRQYMPKGPGAENGPRVGYPEGMSSMNSAFANAAGMGAGYPYGMDFSGYGMGMGGMYSPYGGYPGMGGAGMGAGNPEAMAGLGGRMDGGVPAPYGGGPAGGMYGMMSGAGGFQGGMMGYGAAGEYGQQPQQQQPPPPQGMDPSGQPGMYAGGYGGHGWGQQ